MPERSQIDLSFLPAAGAAPVEWRIEPGLTQYEHALAFMEARADAIRQGSAPEMVWLVEHPPFYTAGTSARIEDLVEPDRFPVFAAGRGGEYTYHGPGQRVAYVMLDLKRRREDVRAFVAALEEWIIRTLDRFNVKGERREDRVGVWVVTARPPASAGRLAGRGQDRCDRHQAAALGELPRHSHQCRAEPPAFLRHCALRRRRPRRDEPCRPRPAGDDGRSRHGAESRLRRSVRTNSGGCGGAAQKERVDMNGGVCGSAALWRAFALMLLLAGPASARRAADTVAPEAKTAIESKPAVRAKRRWCRRGRVLARPRRGFEVLARRRQRRGRACGSTDCARPSGTAILRHGRRRLPRLV